MNSLLNISALEIEFWFDKPESKALFPELIRRLVIATAPNLLQIDFPTGINIYNSGWDGLTLDTIGNIFVPEGKAGWEFGTSRDINAKANSDYAKRTSDSLGLVPSSTTLILVTSRSWSTPAKRAFVESKQAERIWKEVRLYDAADLEVWLSTTPAVQYWLARFIGKRPAGITDIETYWLDWSAETTPATPTTLLTLGRQEAISEVYKWLKSEGNILGLRTDSRSESLAMFAAAMQELPESDWLSYSTRCLIVYTPEAWHELIVSHSSLLLIPLFDNPNIGGATRQGHRIIVPLDQADNNWKGQAIDIPRLPRQEVSDFLHKSGKPQEQADALAGVARRSFAAFRRAMTKHPTIAQPEWVNTDEQDILIAALLIGAWQENKEGDMAIVAQAAAVTDYAQVKSQLIRWLKVPDPPVRLVGSTWFIVDKGDVWSLMGERVTPEQLGRFTQIVMNVLGSVPPHYDLPAENWHLAGLVGKESPYSRTIRESLTTTLAFLGSLEDPLPVAGEPTSDIAARLVTQLLRAANADWRIWSSLAYNLRWLAEAAPAPFLQAVEEGLRGDSPIILKLFGERQDLFSSSSDHPGLLWALETLAWSPSYLLPVTLILGQLTRLIPIISTSNKPINSLREIFLLWYPHTAATLEQRLQVLDELQQREPAVAATLLEQLTPKARSISTGTNKPRWRDWVSPRNITRREVYEATIAIQERLLRNAQQDVARWESIIGDLPDLPDEQQTIVIKQLSKLSQEITADAERIRLRDKIRELVSRHRSFHDADWAMPQAVVDQLAEVLELFEPADIIGKYAWLFSDWPLLPEGREVEHVAYTATFKERQRQALNLIYAQGGLDTVLSFIPHVKNRWALGDSLVRAAVISEAEAITLISRYLKSDNEDEAYFALGIASALRFQYPEADRTSWSEAVLDTHQSDWSVPQQAEWLLRFLPAIPQTWHKVEQLAPEGQAYYWQMLGYFFIEKQDTVQGVNLYLKHNQLLSAVDLLAARAHENYLLPTELTTEVLERVLVEHMEKAPESYKIEAILEKLVEAPDADRRRVIQLEFGFITFSFNYRDSEKPKLIYDELNANPAFFVDLVTRVYRAEGEERRELSKEDSNLNIASWQLLESWRIIPGSSKTGIIDQDYLLGWVTQARELLAANGRQKIGDEQIGQLLSESPEGIDGVWPHEAVRMLLEKLASPDIERGFTIGHYNSRGTTSRSPYEGGVQERELAKKYLSYAKAIEFTSYRTAEILRRMAHKYEREAQREDEEASLNQDLYQ